MPVLVNRDKASFTLTGPDCEPLNDADWKLATPEERKQYYRRLGELTIYRKRRELRLGRDVQGKAFRPTTYTRPDGAKGPPLSPHLANSRFQKWLRAAPTDRSVTIFWSHGWARIVGYHAFKKGPRSLPVRDAVGLAKASFRWAVDAARIWWRNRHVLSLRPTPAPEATETIPIAARPKQRKLRAEKVAYSHLDRFTETNPTETIVYDSGWGILR